MATKKSADETSANNAAAVPAEPAAVPAAAQTAPMEPAPAATAPVEAAPVKTARVKTTPVKTAPAAVDTVPVESVPIVEEPITASSDPETTVLAETTPEARPVQEVIIVDAPVPPRKRGNRLVGLGFAVLASIIFTALFAVAVFVIGLVSNGTASLAFLTAPTFYGPVVLSFLALVLVIAVVNTAGWWTYIITSVLVGAGVYFGTAAVLLVYAGVLTMTQQEANAVYFAALANPLTITAALLAREVAIWTGAILGRRGRKVRERNADERAAYEAEKAELTPTA
jgi:hypothetical protein